jgi:hypothetical protein
MMHARGHEVAHHNARIRALTKENVTMLRIHASTKMRTDDRKLSERTEIARQYVTDRLNAWYTGATYGTETLFDAADLEWIDGAWALDGMCPVEWCDAMTEE